jgi:hypothetical protein
LNPHTFRYQILSLARLPIPPLARDSLGKDSSGHSSGPLCSADFAHLSRGLESGPVRAAGKRGGFALYFYCAAIVSGLPRVENRFVCCKSGQHRAVVRVVPIVGRSGGRIGKKREVATWHPPHFAMRDLNVDKDARCEFAKARSIARRCWCLDAAVPSQGRELVRRAWEVMDVGHD